MDTLLHMFETLPIGTFELMCHPGYADSELLAESTYNITREREMMLLTDVQVRTAVNQTGINLITFAQL